MTAVTPQGPNAAMSGKVVKFPLRRKVVEHRMEGHHSDDCASMDELFDIVRGFDEAIAALRHQRHMALIRYRAALRRALAAH